MVETHFCGLQTFSIFCMILAQGLFSSFFCCCVVFHFIIFSFYISEFSRFFCFRSLVVYSYFCVVCFMSFSIVGVGFLFCWMRWKSVLKLYTCCPSVCIKSLKLYFIFIISLSLLVSFNKIKKTKLLFK